MRDIDPDFQTQLESPARTEIVLMFVTVNDPAHADQPIRVVNENNGNCSFANGKFINYYLNGNLHIGFPFTLALLTDDDQPARARIIVPAVHRTIAKWFREMQTPARLTIDLYALSGWGEAVAIADNARSPIGTPKRLYLADKVWVLDVTIGATQIVLELGGYNFTQEPLGPRATKALCPDLYR